jgi:hypothetical protein
LCFNIPLDSNIAVKNVAETLSRQGFSDFILLVSFEFHTEWHEDQYKQIKDNVITSDNFENTAKSTRFSECTVFLMTVAMTASPRVMNEVLKDRSITHIFMDESRCFFFSNATVKST